MVHRIGWGRCGVTRGDRHFMSRVVDKQGHATFSHSQVPQTPYLALCASWVAFGEADLVDGGVDLEGSMVIA